MSRKILWLFQDDGEVEGDWSSDGEDDGCSDEDT